MGVFALMVGGQSAVAFVHTEQGGSGVDTAVTVSTEQVEEGRVDSGTPTTVPSRGEVLNTGAAMPGSQAPSSEAVREVVKQQIEQVREVAKQQIEQVREAAKEQAEQRREQTKEMREQAREMFKERFELQRESTTTAALSWGQMKQLMKERKQELDDEEASTTPRLKSVMKNANEVRLAVHTLLASKELLGGIGPQVSEIARHMNDSVATTTSAEARIESRGFFTKLLFGGDKKASKDISKAVERNGENIAKLTELLNSANLQGEVKAMLETQLTAMQTQQTRLQDVAAGQAKLWGFFSWRF